VGDDDVRPRRPDEDDDDRPRRRSSDADDDDRPRRRRRRPARSRGGAGKTLLVLAGIGLVLLLCCGGIIGAVALAGAPKWQEFKSPGGYTIDLPAAPRTDMAKIAGKHGPVQPGVTHEGTILIGRLEEYNIVYVDIAPDVRFANTDEQIIDIMVDGMKNAQPPARILATRKVTVSGYTARELEMSIDGQSVLGRIVVTRSRLYAVLAGGRFTRSTDPRLRRFVDSFKIDEPRRAGEPAAGNPPLPKW
jgi:hypothetical protein